MYNLRRSEGFGSVVLMTVGGRPGRPGSASG